MAGYQDLTVDDGREIRRENQLIWCSYPIIYRVFCTVPSGDRRISEPLTIFVGGWWTLGG